MREYSEQSATRRELLGWILNIIDGHIKQEEERAQHYHGMGDKAQAAYFRTRLTWDHAARVFIKDLLSGG